MGDLVRDEKGRIVSTKKEGEETKKTGPKKAPRKASRKEYNDRWGVPLDVEIK